MDVRNAAERTWKTLFQISEREIRVAESLVSLIPSFQQLGMWEGKVRQLGTQLAPFVQLMFDSSVPLTSQQLRESDSNIFRLDEKSDTNNLRFGTFQSSEGDRNER